MGLAPPRAGYDLAKAFMQDWRSAVARRQLLRGGLVRASRTDDLLIVEVLFMPDEAFDRRFLLYGPGHDVPLFTPLGDTWWRDTFRLAVNAAQGADQREGLAGMILLPQAIEAARERLPKVQAVAA